MTATYPRELHFPEFAASQQDAAIEGASRLDESLEKLAAVVRWLYVHCYRDFTGSHDYGDKTIPKWDGGDGDHGQKFKQSWWLKIAKKIAELDAEPMDYVRAQFWGKVNVRPPVPNTFCNELAVVTWRSFCNESRPLDDKARELENDRSSIENVIAMYTYGLKWPREKVLRLALCDKTHVYSTPLYRYCVAQEAGYDRIAAFYFERALLQLLFRYKTYTTVYGDLIPAAMHNAVRELRDYLGLA